LTREGFSLPTSNAVLKALGAEIFLFQQMVSESGRLGRQLEESARFVPFLGL